MPRRRQHNPLLGCIVGFSIAAHLVALPILAKVGAFKKIQQQFIEARLVTLPPAIPEKKQPEVKKAQQTHKTAAAKGKASPPHGRQAAQKSNLSQPKVVASAGNESGGGSNDGPTVDPNGGGPTGQRPTEKKDMKPVPPQEPELQPKNEVKPTVPEVKPQPKVEVKTTPPVEVKPTAAPPPPPKEPVYTEAVAVASPQPALPEDLRADALDKTFVAEFTIGPDGIPTEIKISQSTGNDELDRLALETAKKWRFKPATRDGQPVESKVRLHIEFQVS